MLLFSPEQRALVRDRGWITIPGLIPPDLVRRTLAATPEYRRDDGVDFNEGPERPAIYFRLGNPTRRGIEVLSDPRREWFN